MPENKVPGRVESKAHRLMHDLKKQGFEVCRGYFRLVTRSAFDGPEVDETVRKEILC